VIGQLCRYGASIIDTVAAQLQQQQQLEQQNSSSMTAVSAISGGAASATGGASSTLEHAHSYSGVTSLMASGSSSSSSTLLPAVGTSQCLTLFLRYLTLADAADHGGPHLHGSISDCRSTMAAVGSTVKLCDCAMQVRVIHLAESI
jgi:hypothetical protein